MGAGQALENAEEKVELRKDESTATLRRSRQAERRQIEILSRFSGCFETGLQSASQNWLEECRSWSLERDTRGETSALLRLAASS
jgi:hypothetical protein